MSIKRFLSILLSLTLMFSVVVIPGSALSDDEASVQAGAPKDRAYHQRGAAPALSGAPEELSGGVGGEWDRV